jgi:hypothetical protein
MTLAEFLRVVVACLDRARVPYMVTGSAASSFHGAPRATRDLDMVIDPEPERVADLARALRSAGLYIDDLALETAVSERTQVNAVDGTSGWKVDLIIRRSRPFSVQEFERRRTGDLAGVRADIASAEDVILAKLEWAAATGSDRQIDDAVGIATVLDSALDLDYLDRWAPLLGVERAWATIRDRISEGG